MEVPNEEDSQEQLTKKEGDTAAELTPKEIGEKLKAQYYDMIKNDPYFKQMM